MQSRSGRAISSFLILAAAMLFQPQRAHGADLTFTGVVQQISPQSISIRMADGTVIEARLPEKALPAAAAIAAGDAVRMDCKKIRPVWQEKISHYQFLEVTS